MSKERVVQKMMMKPAEMKPMTAFIVGLAIAAVVNAQEPTAKPRVFFTTPTGFNHAAYAGTAGFVVKNLTKECPEIVIITNQANADYVVSLQSGIPSTISNADGDILHRFGVWQAGRSIAKDVCRVTGKDEVNRLKLLDRGKVKATPGVVINGIAHDNGLEARPQGIITNKDVLALKAAGLGDELIITKIKESPSDFTLGTEDLVALKRANVSDLVISEMMTSAKKGK